MEIEENIKKYKWGILGILLLILLGIWFFMVWPRYEDVYTPKPLEGNSNATVKIVEFSDFQCPACGAAYPVVERIMDVYGDRVSLEYKHFPLTSIHQFAFQAAEASECANDQEKFWEYVDIAFTNQKDLSKRALKRYAKELDLDTGLFNNCLDSGAKKKWVSADFNEGIGKGVGGTPTFFINGKQLDKWNYDNFAAALDAALVATVLQEVVQNETGTE